MNDEDALIRGCLAAPEDNAPRLVYADWLDEHENEQRAELIRLAVSRADLPKTNDGKARQKAVNDRIRELKVGMDPVWAATFDEFDCLISDSYTVQVRITNYGYAPKSYGKRAVKIGTGAESLFMIREGWEPLGGSYYNYFRLPDGQPTRRDPIIKIQVPTDAEIERLDKEWHRRGEAAERQLGPWFVRYSPHRIEKSRRVTPFVVHVEGKETWEETESVRAAEFRFGDTFPWYRAILWEKEDDQLRWIRSDTQVVK